MTNQVDIINYISEEDINGSGISIDTHMMAADEKKEIQERRSIDILGRAFGVMILLSINTFVCLVIGYLYITEKYYLAMND
jgi:hypothetical protein